MGKTLHPINSANSSSTAEITLKSDVKDQEFGFTNSSFEITYIVTWGEFISRSLFNSQVRFFNLCQGVSWMVTQSAYEISSIIEIVGMTAERGSVAQILAIFTAVKEKFVG